MPKAIADASTSSETAPVCRRASKRKAPLPANVVSLQAYRRRIAAVTSIDAEEFPERKPLSDFEVILRIRAGLSDARWVTWLEIGRQFTQGGAA